MGKKTLTPHSSLLIPRKNSSFLNSNFTMKKINYILIAISVVIIILGFVLMAGGKNTLEFNPEIFSFRRITIAPIFCVTGFVLMIVGIMYKKSESQ